MAELAPGATLPRTSPSRATAAAASPSPRLRGRPVVLFFYPKDDTEACTTEAKDFTAAKGGFRGRRRRPRSAFRPTP
jgi:peroxiredoxin Q/BCP